MNNQLRGIYKMRKSLVLALVLVFAIAGASFAATPQFSGELQIKAESNASFTGPFAVSVGKAELGIKFAEEGENWELNVGLAAADLLAGGGFTLSTYSGKMAGEGFDVALARNVNMGALATPFKYVELPNKVAEDRIRFTTELGGLSTAAELKAGAKDIKIFTSTDVNDMTIGAGIVLDQDNSANSSYVGFAKTSFDIVDVDVAVGSVKGSTVWGIGAEAGLTEQLTVAGEYEYDGSWNVEATFTEGVMQAKAGYDNDSVATASFTYRGSEDNQAWADLFKDDKYYLNVAPAFKVSYTTTKSKITLDGTAPLADNVHAKAQVVVEDGDTSITADARVALTDKLTLSPYYASATDKFGAKLNYAVGSGATIGVDGKSEKGTNSLVGTFTIKF